MTYNFTDGFIIDGVAVTNGNNTVYELTIDLTPIPELLILILAVLVLQLLIRRK